MLDGARCLVLDGVESGLDMSRSNPTKLHPAKRGDQVEADESVVAPPGHGLHLGLVVFQPTLHVGLEGHGFGVGEEARVQLVE